MIIPKFEYFNYSIPLLYEVELKYIYRDHKMTEIYFYSIHL